MSSSSLSIDLVDQVASSRARQSWVRSRVTTVKGADGVSVSLQRHGRLTTVAASDHPISEMDADQYATGEGPCVDASIEGRWFHSESLEQEARWPAFVPKAQELGINSILSHPLLAKERPLGALNMYSRTAAAFSGKEWELASVFATEASTILSDAGVDVSDNQLSARIGEALRTRNIIAVAQGVLMERQGISEERAYTVLRTSSQRTGRPLSEEATSTVESTRPSGSTSQIEPGASHG